MVRVDLAASGVMISIHTIRLSRCRILRTRLTLIKAANGRDGLI
jgi:hypothetical protein